MQWMWAVGSKWNKFMIWVLTLCLVVFSATFLAGIVLAIRDRKWSDSAGPLLLIAFVLCGIFFLIRRRQV